MRIEKILDRFCYLLKDYLLLEIDCVDDIIIALNSLLRFVNCQEKVIDIFIKKLKDIKKELVLDIEMFLDSDPAIKSKEEVIHCYPGLFAIMIYRIANYFSRLNINLLPRMLSEFAHEKTGIDIHPCAKIGHHFFIDHGTGIVIGETSIIGNYVKMYQGVTLGAISLSKGSLLKNTKRHPTIKDNVTIYSNATILGSDTIIGNNCIIGCNTVITKSVADNSLVVL